MLSQNKIKFIRSLELKKNRKKHNLFIVEGEKMVLELLKSNIKITEVFAVDKFIAEINRFANDKINIFTITELQLKKISNLKTPNSVLAVAEIPHVTVSEKYYNDLCLAIDNIQDPGNLGTIIRTADWFGIKNIFCSNDSVDIYNPKVVQSTMGAIFRVNVYYTNLKEIIANAKNKGMQVFGTVLSGNNIYKSYLSNNAMIVLGNESKGISSKIENIIDIKIKIPRFPENSLSSESLNVGIANAIVIAEFRRQFNIL
jgi:TrmH family RNA methyltransferase